MQGSLPPIVSGKEGRNGNADAKGFHCAGGRDLDERTGTAATAARYLGFDEVVGSLTMPEVLVSPASRAGPPSAPLVSRCLPRHLASATIVVVMRGHYLATSYSGGKFPAASNVISRADPTSANSVQRSSARHASDT